MGGTSPDAAARGETSTAEIEKVLLGIKYPAERRDLVRYAQFGQAPARIVEALQRLPDRTYHGVPDLRHELGQPC